MRFFYADPGLRNNLGHHANSCRFITRELRARGIETVVLAFRDVHQSLRDELGARPLFKTYTYWDSDGDPICGWLNGFHIGTGNTLDDLSSLADVTADDIVYMNSARPIQFMALVQWLSRLPAAKMPRALLEFGTEPGIEMQVDDEGPMVGLPDLRRDPRALLYRFAAGRLRSEPLPQLHLATFEPSSSDVYSALLGVDVGVLPFPHHATTPPRRRVRKKLITVAVLGHQRTDKGYHLVPAVAAGLLENRRDIMFLAHNGSPESMKDVQQAMRTIAGVERRVILDERVADEDIWRELLDRSDIIVCPYDPARFAASYSAIAVEAIAYGIPLVVPAHTALARLLEEFGNPGITFEHHHPLSIREAVEDAVDDFDRIADRAFAASARWQDSHGPRKLVDAMLTLANGA